MPGTDTEGTRIIQSKGHQKPSHFGTNKSENDSTQAAIFQVPGLPGEVFLSGVYYVDFFNGTI